jgi:hypothetical protein
MLVDPTQSGQNKTHASTHVASRAAASAAQFSTHLAKASTKASARTSDSSWKSKTPPKGEKTQAVAGHAYAEVVAGPRNGLFVNKSGNARDGMAFARVIRDGREFHIYGSGKDRVIVQVKNRDKTPDTPNNATNNTSNAATPGSSTTSGDGTNAPATDTTGAPIADGGS